MNFYILAATILSLGVVFGHFFFGKNWFLKPVLDSNIDEVTKGANEAIFHYSSVFLITATGYLFYGISGYSSESFTHAYELIAMNYLGFGIWQLHIIRKLKIPNSYTKLFQWIMFIIIAFLIFLGL